MFNNCIWTRFHCNGCTAMVAPLTSVIIAIEVNNRNSVAPATQRNFYAKLLRKHFEFLPVGRMSPFCRTTAQHIECSPRQVAN